jgi:hypothetical protein
MQNKLNGLSNDEFTPISLETKDVRLHFEFLEIIGYKPIKVTEVGGVRSSILVCGLNPKIVVAVHYITNDIFSINRSHWDNPTLEIDNITYYRLLLARLSKKTFSIEYDIADLFNSLEIPMSYTDTDPLGILWKIALVKNQKINSTWS